MDSSDITLIVKAPNQQIADHRIECSLDWSIKKLKQHLSFHYPSKPKENEQRLIYLGKLLCDNICLHEVLKYPHDDNKSAFTVHLVCSPTKDFARQNQQSDKQAKGTDNLRQRNVNSRKDQTINRENCANSVSDATRQVQDHVQYYGMYGNMYENTSNTHAVPTPSVSASMHYTPEQMMWFQHVYAQQMAQYMQYMQQQNIAVSTQSQVNNLPGDNLPANVQVHDQMNAGFEARPVQNNNQQMIMNAAGGQAVFENEDDEQNRDWLDWAYSVCRFTVLLAIVYFYSTLGRFVLVFGFFFLIYLYQSGWFRLNRQVQRRVQAEEEIPEEDQTPPEEDESESEEQEETGEVNNPLVETNPGLVRIAFSFVLTFFTSLVPQQPAAVNAN